MTELRDRLSTLAERGAPRGADAVIGAADAAAHGVAADVPPVTMTHEPPAGRRRGRTAYSAGGIAALLGVLTLAVGALVGNGGADSPEAAVRRLADAIAREDPLAAVAVIAPDEVRGLHATLDRAARQAAELALVDSASAPLAGLDLSFEGLQLDATELAPGYVKVALRDGSFSIRSDRDGFSALVQRAIGPEGRTPQAEARFADVQPFDQEPFVVAVRREGGWYVSAAYTALEYVRLANPTSAVPDYGSGRATMASLGADSPEAAAEAMLEAVVAGDWNTALALVSPSEIPLYDYRAPLAELLAEVRPDAHVESFEATTQLDGDRATVTAYALVRDAGGTAFELADDCAMSMFETSDGTQPEQVCISLSSFSLGLFLERDGHAVQVQAVRHDGRWFVSPVGTVLDYVDAGVGRFDRAALYSLLGLAHELEPEGAITLGVEVRVPAGIAHVYTFEGRAGQQVVGTVAGERAYAGVEVQLFGPDGRRVEEAWGIVHGEPARLPVDGSYRVVVQRWFGSAEAGLTLWDVDHAPPEAFEPRWGPDSGGAEECTAWPDGRVECSSYATAAEPVPRP